MSFPTLFFCACLQTFCCSPFSSLSLPLSPRHPPTKKRSLRWKSELGDSVDPASLLVVASPFARTLETATLASAAVGVRGFENLDDDENGRGEPGAGKEAERDPRFVADEALRERHFGGFELQSHDHYKTVWLEDARDVRWRAEKGEGEKEGESVVDVAGRLRALFEKLESKYENRNILLVAHGDTLSIATAVARGGGLGKHREHAQETGELRKL